VGDVTRASRIFSRDLLLFPILDKSIWKGKKARVALSLLQLGKGASNMGKGAAPSQNNPDGTL